VLGGVVPRRVIRLAARLAVSGGRESAVRLVLTAVGVGIGTALLLFALAADPAVRAQQQHQAWRWTGRAETVARPRDHGSPLLWRVSDDAVDGRPMRVVEVAATGPGAPRPLGLDHVPRAGEVAMSRPLADLVRRLPRSRLADRFPSLPTATIGRAYLAGPDDLVAVVGRPPEDLEGTLAVHRINTVPQQFGFTDFLRLVFAIGAVALILPVLVFVSTSTRLGAARREQRFAALRLAGATPRQTNLIASVEAAAAAAIGALLGVAGFLGLRPAAASVVIDGHPSFPADVRVAPLVLMAVVLAVPVLALVAATVSLRRLQVSPLGVARRAVRPRPTIRRLVPLVVGAVSFVLVLMFGAHASGLGIIALVVATFSLVIVGIVVAGPWLTVLTARGLRRVGARPASLLAGRRLEDDPASGFRAVSGLVLAVFVASVFSGVTPALVAEGGDRQPGVVAPSTLVANLPGGTTVAQAQAGLAAAQSSGAGRGFVAFADPEPVSAELQRRGVTSLVVACGDLPLLGIVEGCADATHAARVEVLAFVKESAGVERLQAIPSAVSSDALTSLPPEYVVVTTSGAAAVTDRVRTAIERTLPGSFPWLGSEASARDNSRIVQLERLANLALALSLIIAGCGLAVSVAGGIIERKRPFGLLRLSGMHLRELQGVAMLEASAPLLLIAVASAFLGLAISAVIVGFAGGIPWRPPTFAYWSCLLGGLGVAMAVAAATLPLLGRATAVSAVRFE
jgi:hypothetical protein